MNKVILMGNLTKDPELTYTPNNVAVCKFTIAVQRSFAKPGEERQSDFINCVGWRNTAEFISKHFAKGRKIAVSGSIQVRNWDDAEGKKRYATEVVVDEAHFCDKKTDSNNSNSSDGFEPVDFNPDSDGLLF